MHSSRMRTAHLRIVPGGGGVVHLVPGGGGGVVHLVPGGGGCCPPGLGGGGVVHLVWGGGGVVTMSQGGGGCCPPGPGGEGRCCPEAFGVATPPPPLNRMSDTRL